METGNATPDVPETNSLPEGTSRQELVAFVEEALTYAQENGKDRALQEFNDQEGDFVDGDRYIFAIDFEGILLANPFRSDLIGKNRTDWQDINGIKFVQNLANLATSGGGFTYYLYPNPEKNMIEELKLGYAMKVDDTWWLGSGIYLADVPSYFSPDSRQELVAFVEDAVAYAEENGKDEAIQEFNDLEGDFVDGNRYIFADDFERSALAHPYQPDLIGVNRIDSQDANGVTFVRDMIDLAKKGGGFTYYLYPNPGKNMIEELKLSYVMKVDDTWWLGSGIYVQDADEMDGSK
ncbi:MAG: cache domain-containing protein [Methanotrichaceae archaeon]